MPYNPGISYHGDAYIAQAGNQIGDSLAGAVANIGQEKKQAKAMQAMFEAMAPEPDVLTGEVKAHPLGITADQFKSLSWKDQIAKMGGFIKAVNVKSALQELADRRRQQQQNQDAAAGEGQLFGQPEQTDAAVPRNNLPIPAAMPDRREAGVPPATDYLSNDAFGGPLAAAGPLGNIAPVPNALATLGAQRGDTTEAPIRPPPAAAPPDRYSLQGILAGLARLPQNQRQALLASGKLNPLLSIVERLQAGTERAPKTLSFVKSPSGADIALSPDTGAFQYDPFSKEEAKPRSKGRVIMADPDDPFGRTRIEMDVEEFAAQFPEQYKRMTKSEVATGQGKLITDKKGKKWLYLGSATDPNTDKDPKNWKAQ